MEQLPLVCPGRSGSGANQRVGGNRGQDVGRLPGFPPAHPFAKTAKGLGTRTPRSYTSAARVLHPPIYYLSVY
jgi:hypothetical protein